MARPPHLTWAFALILLVLSAATHFFSLALPAQVVFDEIYMGRYSLGYLTGEYFFDVHPPLAKLLAAGAAKLSGFDPAFGFSAIGAPYPDGAYWGMRAVPALAGTLLPVVLFAVARLLGLSLPASVLVGGFVLLDNALLVLSRILQSDPMLLLFGAAAVGLALWSRNRPWPWLLGVGVVAGCAVSVKWTGLGFVVVVLLVELLALGAARVGRSLGRMAIVMGMAAVVYVATFAVHFSLQTKQGPGAAFHTPSFQANLAGNPYQRDASIAPMGFVGRLIEANQVMWRANVTLTATHPYASKWYSWPFMFRSIYMWNQSSGAGEARIYLIGNPVVWWLSAYGMLFLLINLPVRVGSLARDAFAGDPRAVREALITAGLVANLLPFAVIGRPMFLYHYLPALLFAVLAAGHFFDRLSLGRWCVFGALVVAAAVFFYFAPLTYGWPLTDLEHQRRLWLESWR